MTSSRSSSSVLADYDLISTEVGVGVLYSGALAEPLVTNRLPIDLISVIPETLWHESHDPPRYRLIPSAVDLFDTVTAHTPVVFHGIGLSIGGGRPLDIDHVRHIAAAADRYQAGWYSEHLAAFRVGHEQMGEIHAGVGLPVPFDSETLRQLAPKLSIVIEEVGRPVLLENSAIYVEVPDSEMTEAAFLNRLCEATGAGVLLDLHNLFVNQLNLRWDAELYLAELDLANVVEIHVAGGEMLGAWYTDAHSGACPAQVWELLDRVVPFAPALRAVTFELHESRYPTLGLNGLNAELSRIRSSIGGARVDVA